jgi:hypothetical protein
MVNIVMKIKFIINTYSQVFKGVGPGYGELAKFIILGQNVGFPGETSLLLMLDFIQLAVHQPCKELMPDCSRDLMTR